MLGRIRQFIRGGYFEFLRRTFNTGDGKEILADSLSGLLCHSVVDGLDGGNPTLPYPELGRSKSTLRSSDRSDIVIITGRFRSGSTLLWNLFRHIEGCTSYYEPFNERRWFNLSPGDYGTDATHRNVSDYWREYQGLEVLGSTYREEWTSRQLLMNAHDWDPGMKIYVETLINSAQGRPILQFNRIDLRLPWFRRHFPNARFVHVFRHPRDQWCSTLMDDLDRMPRKITVKEFAPYDRFYLRRWASDLKYHFPFLDESFAGHPYRLFYFLWRLSYNSGLAYCDYSIQFERLAMEPAVEITALLNAVGIDHYDLDHLLGLISPPKLGRWREYADDSWFTEHESECENILNKFYS